MTELWNILKNLKWSGDFEKKKKTHTAHHRWKMKNNNEMTVNVVPGILSFQICERESEQRLPKELKLKKVSLAFGLEISENWHGCK